MTTPDCYTQEELAFAGLSADLVLAIAFVDDGKGSVRRVFMSEGDDGIPVTDGRVLGIVAPPPGLCVIRENPTTEGDQAPAEPKTLGLGRIDGDGNFSVREPWARRAREALAWHAELMRVRATV
jgi:hypothetical protein